MAKGAFKVRSGGKWKSAPKGSKVPKFSNITNNAGYTARPTIGYRKAQPGSKALATQGGNMTTQGPRNMGAVSPERWQKAKEKLVHGRVIENNPVQGPKKPTGAENKKRKQDSSFGEKAERLYKAAGLNVNRETGRMAKSYKEGGAKGLGKYAMDNHKGKILTGAGLAVAGVGTAAYRKRQEDKKFKNRVKDRLGIRR